MSITQFKNTANVTLQESFPVAVPLGTPVAEGAEPPCPACGFVGPLQAGACGDCGLQLE